tara:strand:+ start:72 stop:383 length:312 start_codon:yes stop_codon:yes gene_type:complete
MKLKEVFVVAYAINDMIPIIKINLMIIKKYLNIPRLILFIKSADTLAFRKKALGIAKKATNAIPISTNSIVPVTGELKKRLPKTSQKVNNANAKRIKPEAIAE